MAEREDSRHRECATPPASSSNALSTHHSSVATEDKEDCFNPLDPSPDMGFNPLFPDPEVRMLFRHIPYFYLPNYETVHSIKSVKAKVNSQNPGYRPARPSQKAQAATSQKKPDYSHVTPRVCTGLGRKDQGLKVASHRRQRSSSVEEDTPPATYPLSQSLQKRPFSAGAVSRLTPSKGAAATTPGFSHVKARVGSFENLHFKQGGSDRGAKMPEGERKARGCSQGSGEMEGTRKRFSGKEDSKEKPRVKVWENIGHTPRGGNVKYPTFKVDHFKRNAKSRLDQSDPNPAHKMQHSLHDLEVAEGNWINPRFHPLRDQHQGSHARGQLRFARRLPSAENGDRPDPDDVASEDTERWTAFSKSTPIHSISEDGETGVTDDSRQAEPQEELSESEALSAAVVLSSNGYTGRREGSESDCDSDEMGGAKVAPEAPRPNDPVYSPAFIQEEDTEEDGLTVEAGYGKDGHENEIVDVEVENSASETTVTLVHILPLLKASGRSIQRVGPSPSLSMPAISEDIDEESDEEEEEEEEETFLLNGRVEFDSAIFDSMFIPRLIISGTAGELIETVHSGRSPKTEREGQSATPTLSTTGSTHDATSCPPEREGVNSTGLLPAQGSPPHTKW